MGQDVLRARQAQASVRSAWRLGQQSESQVMAGKVDPNYLARLADRVLAEQRSMSEEQRATNIARAVAHQIVECYAYTGTDGQHSRKCDRATAIVAGVVRAAHRAGYREGTANAAKQAGGFNDPATEQAPDNRP
jgi:hypothetical protein